MVGNCVIKLEILNKSTHLNQSQTQITVMSDLFFCECFSLIHVIITTIIKGYIISVFNVSCSYYNKPVITDFQMVSVSSIRISTPRPSLINKEQVYLQNYHKGRFISKWRVLTNSPDCFDDIYWHKWRIFAKLRASHFQKKKYWLKVLHYSQDID